ncbi:MAG: hypothetical protein JSW33_07890 [bacterium]|nr:MAG: hypothetical protein JSW33_07890 [bacterium]
MGAITIYLPGIEAEKYIDAEIRVNGKKKKYHFRVEIFEWKRCEVHEARAICLKKIIDEYPKEWQLVNIGEVTDDYIHLLFKSCEEQN